jgi:hypothetical protein
VDRLKAEGGKWKVASAYLPEKYLTSSKRR